jgi:hypothetical protein
MTVVETAQSERPLDARRETAGGPLQTVSESREGALGDA